MKAHKYWSIGALITMIGTFYTGYKGSKSGHRYFACMIYPLPLLRMKSPLSVKRPDFR